MIDRILPSLRWFLSPGLANCIGVEKMGVPSKDEYWSPIGHHYGPLRGLLSGAVAWLLRTLLGDIPVCVSGHPSLRGSHQQMRREPEDTYESGSKCTSPVSLGTSLQRRAPPFPYLGNEGNSSLEWLGLWWALNKLNVKFTVVQCLAHSESMVSCHHCWWWHFMLQYGQTFCCFHFSLVGEWFSKVDEWFSLLVRNRGLHLLQHVDYSLVSGDPGNT